MFKKVYIEITNVCNLKCKFCPETNRKKEFIKLEDFENIINKIKKYTNLVYLHVKGEPLLHPDLKEILNILSNNNLKVNISEQLGERIHGVSSWAELPQDFEAHQFSDENYKESFGESRKEATTRIVAKFNQILNENREKRIIIVAHSTIFAYLLSNWCEVSYDKEYKFENNVFFDGSWNYCETFKMTFDDTKLLSIKNLKFN